MISDADLSELWGITAVASILFSMVMGARLHLKYFGYAATYDLCIRIPEILEVQSRSHYHREGDVTEPDFVVRVIRADRWYLCIIRYERDRKELEQRRAPHAPIFFSGFSPSKIW